MASAQDPKSVRFERVNANSFEAEPLLAHTEVLQPKQERFAQPGAAGATPVPQPPYDETHDINEGLRCYYPGCAVEGYRWGDLLAHMDTEHQLKFKSIEGTYFHKMGMKVIARTKFTLSAFWWNVSNKQLCLF